ncbi:restriction endonuclease [Pseudomonas sp. FW305-17]|nr:restriction endonuclease [Pseudomonas sp. FW305-42]PNA24338.1 restriction endonuclease [Pseudomonas sp. MPR-R1B]PNB24869.1 restriction endonuclease [Pseudomonas sp. DP16D-E2]PNB42931.1 restriction endonuclease [Pseudomonas sp. FW305-17]PNB63411.1 restriction endonuclease [Pseudomonas sp. GW531-E2]PNB66818.1 restriction endonuclease [Pseudomonas sp. FW305-127]
MRRSHATNTLVIVSNHVKSVYDDRWEGDIFHYTGMGQHGNQSLRSAQNKTLNESPTNKIKIHLFEVFEPKQYTYIGEVILVGDAYEEKQYDARMNLRNVWVFPLKLCASDAPKIPASSLLNVIKEKEKKIRKFSDVEIEENALRTQQLLVSRRHTEAPYYLRSIWVAEFAKRRAKGNCELCTKPAPFERRNGEPYLETHHIHWLASGGADSVENTVALCPNCHRRMHIINCKKDIRALQQKARR